MKNVLFERTVYNIGKTSSGHEIDTTVYATEEVNGYGVFTTTDHVSKLMAWITNKNEALISAVEYVQALQQAKGTKK